MNIQAHIYTRPALMENLNRFTQIIKASHDSTSKNHAWMESFVKGMTHLINLTHLFTVGKISENDVRNGTSRMYYLEDFLSKCCEKLFEFTAIVDKHYDGVVYDDVKQYDSESLPVCTPKMIEYVGQNLIRRIMYIAAEPEINAFIEEHPEMLPYPMLNETSGLFYLRVLLSSIYITIARTTKHNTNVRRMLLRSFVQMCITIVPFWEVVDMMKYPFTKVAIRNGSAESDVILSEVVQKEETEEKELEKKEDEKVEEKEEEIDPNAKPIEVNVKMSDVAIQLENAVPVPPDSLRRRHTLPENLTKFNLRKLITQRLKEAKEAAKHKPIEEKVIQE